MSVQSWEAVLVKVEPLLTDDSHIDTEKKRNSHDTQLELKEEPDWNIQDYLATSRCKGHVVQNHLVCSRSKDMTHMEQDRTNLKDQSHKTDIQVGFHIESIVKIEGDIDLPDVNKANWQVNEYTHKSHNTELMQSKTQASYTNNNKETASANSVVASPTSLYIEHVVKIEREIDEDLEVTVPCRQAQVDKAAETKADNTRHPEVANDSETVDTDLKAECASPVAGLYVDHVVEKDLVVGPETLQKPNLLHCQAMNGAGSNTAFDGCFVRLETMHVDVERGVCRIGLNKYKLGPCLHQDYYTQQEIKGPNVQKDQNKQMITNAKLLRYQVSNIQEKPFKCDICHFATTQKHRLTVHKRSHSDDKPFRCQLCSYASAFKAHLVIHEKTHAIHKPFKCDKCNYACVQKSDLLVHERVHTGVKPFKCDYCVYACRRKRDLLKHIRTHTGEKPFKCELCDYGCIRKRDLIVHANAHRMPDGEEIKVIQKLFECGKCSYASLRKRDLLQHERVHTGEKPFKCDYCVYASSRKRDLLTHIKAHIGEKRYKCKQCIYDCSCKQDFPTHTNTRHIIDGRDEKRHKCSYCDYKTNHKSHMLVHQRKHTGEKPFKCKHCKYATPYRRDLLVHETLHNGEKPHKCNSCSYACGSLSNLRTHEKIHAG